MGTKPTLYPFPRGFLGLVVIEIVVVPPERDKTKDKVLYDMLWLRRYSAIKIGSRAGVIPYPDTWKPLGGGRPLLFTLVSENARKFFCILRPNTWKIFGWGVTTS